MSRARLVKQREDIRRLRLTKEQLELFRWRLEAEYRKETVEYCRNVIKYTNILGTLLWYSTRTGTAPSTPRSWAPCSGPWASTPPRRAEFSKSSSVLEQLHKGTVAQDQDELKLVRLERCKQGKISSLMVFNTFLIISYEFFSSTTRGYPSAYWLASFLAIQDPDM